ncbi:245_t:CDS:1, partial [Racocetra persica]
MTIFVHEFNARIIALFKITTALRKRSQNERSYDVLMGILPFSSEFVADNWNWYTYQYYIQGKDYTGVEHSKSQKVR